MRISPDDAAFACTESEENYGQVGLSKREYAAIAALQGLLADHEVDGSPQEVAGIAVKYADALLEELAKPQE